jgi:hypothetical protein
MNCNPFRRNWASLQRKLLLACLLGAWGPAPVLAQAGLPDLGALPLAVRSNRTAPGIWVEYSLLMSQNGQHFTLRLAALDQEGEGQWFEQVLTDSHQLAFVTKVFLRSVKGEAPRPTKIIIQPPGQQPLLLPQTVMPSAAVPLQRSARLPAKPLAQPIIHLQAGTFATKLYREIEGGKVTQLWFSAKLPGWSLVKLQSPGFTLELAAYGAEARSQIHGEPVEVHPSMFPVHP